MKKHYWEILKIEKKNEISFRLFMQDHLSVLLDVDINAHYGLYYHQEESYIRINHRKK